MVGAVKDRLSMVETRVAPPARPESDYWAMLLLHHLSPKWWSPLVTTISRDKALNCASHVFGYPGDALRLMLLARLLLLLIVLLLLLLLLVLRRPRTPLGARCQPRDRRPRRLRPERCAPWAHRRHPHSVRR